MVTYPLKKLGEIGIVIAGQSPEGKFYNKNGNGLPFYQGKKDFGEKYIGDPTTWTTDVTKEAIEDDILMSVRAPVGPINFSTGKICIGRGLAAIRGGKNVNKNYLFYFLLSIQNLISGNSGAVFDSINKRQIEEIEIPLPPLSVQEEIVVKLDAALASIDEAKTKTQQALAATRELWESTLEEAFHGGDDWEERKLKEIGQTQTGLTPKTSNKAYYGDFIPFITPADIDIVGNGSIRYDNKGLSESGLKVGRMIKENSVMMVCIGATIGKVGFSEDFVSCNQQINTLTPVGKYEPKIFYYLLSTRSFYNKVILNSSQATLPIINKSKWENLSVKFPKSISEQSRIVVHLDTVRAEIDRLATLYEQKLADLDELRRSVLQEAFAQNT